MPAAAKKLVCLGLGYVAEALARAMRGDFAQIVGTTRSEARAAALERAGIGVVLFDAAAPDPAGRGALEGVSHLLISIPPGKDGDPVLAGHVEMLSAMGTLEWIGYLSTTGVYGDRRGGWVAETDPPNPRAARAKRRLEAERSWLGFGAARGIPVQVFRLAGIYGPGRSPLDQLRAGTARRIAKPGQVFSRVHVDDISAVIAASIARPEAGPVFNVCDDEPASQSDVVTYAAGLLGIAPPREEPFETAGLSPMARSFYAESRRVRNDRIKSHLGVALRYPTYREGLRALARAGHRGP